jgi:anti-sigma regulatory factor (Ser/Thr protein kinase)
VVSTSFAPSITAPAEVRALVEYNLQEPGLEHVKREAVLLASELVTNAVLHAHSVVDVELRVDESHVRIEVVDFGDGEPSMREPNGSGGGYGLRIVDRLATSWGHEKIVPYGKRVWFELAR